MYELAVLDFETTGVDPEQDEVLQVAIIDGEGRVLMDELCRPQRAVTWEAAQKVNGIAPETVAGRPPFSEFAPQARDILAKAKTVVAYNAPFEQGFLRAAGVEPSLFRWADPMVDFAKAFGGQKRKLATAAGVFDYQFSAHDALEDVRATLFVYRALEEGVLRRIVRTGAEVMLADETGKTVMCRAPADEKGWLYAHRALGLCPLTAAQPRQLYYKGPQGAAACTLEGVEDRSAAGDWLVLWVRANGRLTALDSDYFKEMQSPGFTGLWNAPAAPEDATESRPQQLVMDGVAAN